MKIGILALQGDYEAHAKIIQQLGIAHEFVNQPAQLKYIDGLIIPGGESTTMLKLMQEMHLFEALKSSTVPIFGTCAGAILLADKVISPEQISLNRIPMTIKRNAYGRQLDSHISEGIFVADKSKMQMMFIRAPRISHVDDKVEVIVKHNDEPVCVRYKNCLACAFHPEILNETKLHRYFLENCLN